MAELQRLVALNGETQTQTHSDEIGQIMQEMNLQDSALTDVQDALKRSSTAVVSIALSDYTSSLGFFNEGVFKPYVHGLPYIPLVFGYIFIYGAYYQTPFQDFDPATGIYRGTIDLTPGATNVYVQANYNNVTPLFTAYIFVTTAAGTVAVAS